MIRCATCGGWSPTVHSCPNSAAGSAPAPRSWLRSVGVAIGCASVGMTLAACYGSPCAQYGADGECIAPGPQPGANFSACEDLYAKRGAAFDEDPHCVPWRDLIECNHMAATGDPNLVTAPECEGWRQDERCAAMAKARDPKLLTDQACHQHPEDAVDHAADHDVPRQRL